tara:strand:- start:922 stop:1695 length:774 start_codon:yes stop_codon:yes gene_type:complete
MSISAEKIQENWKIFTDNISLHIIGDRREKLLEFYTKHQDELCMMPASHKKAYHNAFPGGYIDHVNRVVEGAQKLHKVWGEMEVDTTTYTYEELIFSAINHDLGKMGDGEEYSHIPSKDEWRKKNMGEMYQFNKKIAYMSVPDRSIFLLTQEGIKLTYNEHLAIKLHDGLYDPANESYFKSFMVETKPRTSLIYIIHHADMMAARIEFEKEWLPTFKNSVDEPKKNYTFRSNKKTTTKSKALGTIKSEGLKNLFDKL